MVLSFEPPPHRSCVKICNNEILSSICFEAKTCFLRYSIPISRTDVLFDVEWFKNIFEVSGTLFWRKNAGK